MAKAAAVSDDVIERFALRLEELRRKVASAEIRLERMGPVVDASGRPRRGTSAERVMRVAEIAGMNDLVADAEVALERAVADHPRRARERAKATAADSEAELVDEKIHGARLALERLEREAAELRAKAAAARHRASRSADELDAAAEAERRAAEIAARDARIAAQVAR